jgi:anthranilate/para-aminobenzoate synthase component I
MSSPSPCFYPGLPAAWCSSQDAVVDLQGVAEALSADQPWLVWLDSARPHPVTGRYSILGWDPWLVLSSSGDGVVECRTSRSKGLMEGNPFDGLRRTLRRYPGAGGAGLPPAGVGLLGFLGYELNRWIERLPSPKPTPMQTPELLMLGMRMLLVVDHARETSACVSVVDPHQPRGRAVRDARARLEAFEAFLDAHASPKAGGASSRISDANEGVRGAATPLISQGQFEDMVRKAQDYIGAGEIFQANLSQSFEAAWTGRPLALYLALRRINPSPFACFFNCPEFAIVSCSPERLIQVQDGHAQTRPIAGTRPRGRSPEEDVLSSLELILSDKERAEHIMLVDLARNDLGKVCRFGSVSVDELMTLEEYSHVIHIVSNVQGDLKGGADAVDVIRALFPGGTITGCPKVRCMEIIHELEPVARGLYTGSSGYLGFNGSLDLNILIRTMVLQRGGRLTFHVGAGIVADSQPDGEYHETLAKAGALAKALQRCLPRSASGGRPTAAREVAHDELVH